MGRSDNPYASPDLDSYDRRDRGSHPHSGPGIASFLISLLASAAMFVLIVVAGVMESSRPNGVDENSSEAVILGLAIFGVGALLLMALILGVVGLCQTERNKLFAILGTIVAGMTILGTGGLIVLGLMVGD